MAYPIKPGLVVKTDLHQTTRVSPLTICQSRPPSTVEDQKLVMWTTIRVDVAHKASIFEHHDHFVRKLNNLHWFPVKINPGHTRRKTAVHGSFESLAGFFVRPKYGFGGPVFASAQGVIGGSSLLKAKLETCWRCGRVQLPNSGQISLRRPIPILLSAKEEPPMTPWAEAKYRTAKTRIWAEQKNQPRIRTIPCTAVFRLVCPGFIFTGNQWRLFNFRTK